MNKKLLNMSVVIGIGTLAFAFHANAVDQMAAAADLVRIGTVSVQVKADLAKASLNGDVEAIAKADKRSGSVDAAMARAEKAYSTMERAVASGDEAAAQSAATKIKEIEKALNALGEAVTKMVASEQVKQTANTGEKLGHADDAPNMYDVPWQTDLMRDLYQGLWGNLWASGRVDGGFGDKDATPE